MPEWMQAGAWLPESTEQAVSRRIHALWKARRLSLGWRLGAPDAACQTSPYLKPLDEFSPHERQRETWLCRGDLLAIRKALGGCSMDGIRQVLPTLAGDLAFLEQVAGYAHGYWREINLFIGHSGDARLATPFADMSPQDRSITLDNVAIDVCALRQVLDETGRSCQVQSGPC